uniref:Mic1 domain-containing protein n=1 Tax=Haptolina ericina TaxID=156174 RepID=A0A7S3ETR7_9EUKA|mmetsp:Transcript_22754/g.51482  ORF Transcript_22754/g.51482 Transcript_22754/m.51482 type:complete len:267 (+) Transcript_22754:1-801(+)
METDYPPAAALAVDILRRLGPAANHTIVERLLRRGELLTACRFIRQQGLLSYPARPLLQAAAACPDPQTFAHVFGFLMQRNEVWRGSAAFLPEEGCDDYVRRYMGSFGRYMSEGGFVAEPCTAHADPSQFDVGEPSAAAVTAPAVPESSTALRQEIERMREEEAYCIKARDWLGAERAKEKVAALAAQLGAQRGPIAACMPAGHTMSDPPPAFALAPADDDEPLVNAVPEWLSQLISAEALAQGMVIVMSVLSLVAIGLGLVAAVS